MANYSMTNDLMIAFLHLCDPRRDSFADSLSEQDWHSISELSKLHGVTPFLFYRTRQLGIPVPEEIKRGWLGIYLFQLAQEKKARSQIKELKEILDSEGIPMILLKGASAMLRLYPESGLRTFCDLDVLIPEAMVPRFKGIMTKIGYKPIGARNSPEYEDLLKFDLHLDPLRKDEVFTIEPHLNVLGGIGKYWVAIPEIWRDKEGTGFDGEKVDHLSIEHFIIHALVHCVKHLSANGVTDIKGLVDVLYALKTRRIDWLKIINYSSTWGIEKDIFPIMATLNHYWQAGIPLSETPEPLALNVLVFGEENREKRRYANLPAGYLKRLLGIRELPNPTSQARYLFHLFFPTRDNLRWRYNLSSSWSIIPYYFVHFLYRWKKFFAGLWYQILLHPK